MLAKYQFYDIPNNSHYNIKVKIKNELIVSQKLYISTMILWTFAYFFNVKFGCIPTKTMFESFLNSSIFKTTIHPSLGRFVLLTLRDLDHGCNLLCYGIKKIVHQCEVSHSAHLSTVEFF